MTRIHDATPAERARSVIALTVSAWQVPPASPHEVARRAPRGYVPARVLRRIRAAARVSPAPLLAHSW